MIKNDNELRKVYPINGIKFVIKEKKIKYTCKVNLL